VSDQKTERLINLTLALLSSKRYLTKSEIFKVVAGYSGSPETMERMFERDKDDLRNLGIRIEVRGLDPLFEDDQGYLIDSDTHQISPDNFSKEDI
jgi:proteasome accessory factor B